MYLLWQSIKKNRYLRHVKKMSQNLKDMRISSLDHEEEMNAELIISVKTFPARFESVYITLLSLFNQTIKPNKIVLVLDESEMGNHEVPEEILKLRQNGLEILRVNDSGRSYDKLLPVIHKYPEATIITCDDDVIYEDWRVEVLVKAHEENPEAIIGHRGHEMLFNTNQELLPYMEWIPATNRTPSEKLLLTGAGGILYPPHLLNANLLTDLTLARSLAPIADDIWFWVVARVSEVKTMCLGNNSLLEYTWEESPDSLSIINRNMGQNDVQLGNVLTHFKITLP